MSRCISLVMLVPIFSIMLLRIFGQSTLMQGYFLVSAFSTHRYAFRHSISHPAELAIPIHRSIVKLGLRSQHRTTALFDQLQQQGTPRPGTQSTGLRKQLQSIRNWTRRTFFVSMLHGLRLRRRLSVFVSYFFILQSVWFQSATMYPPSAHAAPGTSSSARSTVFTERLLDKTSPSVDAIVDKYIRQHMFDDDLSLLDPVSGTYREAYSDMTTGRYPGALREIISDTLRGSKLDLAPSTEVGAKLDVGALLTRTINFLQRRLGLTELTATIVLALGFVLAGPSLFLFTGMMVGGISKRNMDKVFKKRYGDTYTVDATIKQEPTVEAPPDEGDDDEEDDDGDDEDDDDGDNSKDKKTK